MDNPKSVRYLAVFLFITLLALFLVISFLSEGYYGGADNINHYFISRYSWQHPELLFHGWGRPLYTILSSPFAQFGFKACKVFNVLLAALTVWTGWLLVKKLDLKPRLPVMIFISFAPVYFVMIPTTLTEILCGFILLFSVYLFYSEKYIWSAILVSFIYFARTESMIFYPIFMTAYILKKQYKAIPFLLTGILLFTIAGGIFYNDVLWLIHKFPYPVHHNIYKERGPLLHFFMQRHFILGKPLEYLFVLGIIILFFRLFSKEKETRERALFEILLVLVPLAGFFGMHSVFFWKALGSSTGAIRNMAVIMPLAAIICMEGYCFIDRYFLFRTWLKYIFMTVVAALVISFSFKTNEFPIKMTNEEKCIRSAAEWFKGSSYSGHLFFYNDPNFPFYLDINPYDNKISSHLYYARSLYNLPDSSIVVWDAHFGANECEIPRDSLVKSRQYKLIARFSPLKEAKTFGGFNYEVLVFLKLPASGSSDNLAILGWMKLKEDSSYKEMKSFINEFEIPSPGLNTSKLTGEVAHSGKQSYRMDEASRYGPGFSIRCKEISNQTDSLKIKVTLFIYPLTRFESPQPTLVISLEDQKKSYDYTGKSIQDFNLKPRQWNEVFIELKLAPVRSGNDQIKVYIFNPDQQTFFIDDLRVDVSGPKNGNK